jgi:ribosomal protein S18 acetylase RimI-like enzyme
MGRRLVGIRKCAFRASRSISGSSRKADINPANHGLLAMPRRLEARHDLTPDELDAIEDRLYQHNSRATGCHDGQGLGFVIRDDAGRTIGVAAGYSWAGISELKQLWVDEAYRARGYGRELLNAFVAEAHRRCVRRIWVASYDFQAPGMYEKAGFMRMAEFEGWPEDHVNVVLCKKLVP